MSVQVRRPHIGFQSSTHSSPLPLLFPPSFLMYTGRHWHKQFWDFAKLLKVTQEYLVWKQHVNYTFGHEGKYLV